MQVDGRKARRFMGGVNLSGLLLTILLLPILLSGTAGVAAAGGTWSAPTSSSIGTTYQLNSVAYGGGKWVAVGAYNTNGTSTDGLSWNNATFTGTYYSVAYNSSNGTWIMTGANGKVYTSSNASTWTPTTVFGNIEVWAVTPGTGNTYVAVGVGGNTGYFNGTGWSTTTNGTNDLYGVTYGGGQFVSVGMGGNIYTSSNGTSWTHQSSGTATDLWTVKYANGVYVAGGSGGLILTSVDGVAWTSRSTGGSEDVYNVAYGGGQWVAVTTGGAIYSSTNAVTWSPETSGTADDLYWAAYGNGRWVAVGNFGTIRTRLADSNPPVTGISGVPGGPVNTNVALTLSATDDVSGVANTYYKLDGGAQTAGTTVTVSSQGNHTLQYWSVDNAGNTETANSASFTIDKTAPTLSGAATTSPNGAGWYNSNVTVHWTYSDALSGIDTATQPADATISTEGTTGSASATVKDLAGNTASATVSGIKLDKTAPATTAAGIPGNTAHASNANVTLTLSATDSLSGVASTYYQIDGGAQTAGTSVTLSTEGSHTITYWSADNAGNSESQKTATVVIDKTAPTISHTLTPAPNANGWNNADVSVTFNCADPGGSGVASCTGAQSVTAETAGQAVSGTATDAAGNTATDSVTVKLDKTAPTLTGAATTAPIYSGWYAGDVAIHWTANDARSGIDPATLPVDSVITGEGGSLSASATVKDLAGNTGNGNITGIKIDRTAPSTNAAGLPAGGISKTGVTLTLSATDTGSGVATTYYILDGSAQQVGTSAAIAGDGAHTLEYWSKDNVGNEELPHHTVNVTIDGTAPTISHTLSGAANGAGWHNAPVTVTFTCADAGSGVAFCTADQTVSTDGQNQTVTGTATDNAGNTATDSVTLSIDATAPGLTVTPDRAPTAGGWYKGDVTLTFACSDVLSGVDSCPAQATISGEGVHDNDYTATDVAGNSTTVHSTIRIDLTAPTLSGAATIAPNGAGWYRGDVTIAWTAADALSGIAAAPADSTITGEGTDFSASKSVTDNAGNSTSATVTGINIDRTAPATTDDAPTGWQTADVTVHFAATDALSGVAVTHYSLDGGAAQDGAAATIMTDGTHSLQYWSVDVAGNAETAHTVTVKLDKTNPTISHGLNPAPNADGWNKADVTVTFTCADATSGVATCMTPVTLTTETAGQAVTGGVADNAGNTATDSVTVKLDKTAPTISGAADRAANASGWYNADVTVTFTCADALSGVASCTSPVTLGEGGGQNATGTAVDAAGNSGSATVNVINIDETKPTLSGAATAPPNANGWYNSDVTIHWTAADALSGIDTATVPADATVTGEGAALPASASVSDKAGNSQTTTVTVQIDRQAPSTTDNAPAGWQNAAFTVTLAPTDALSGVANTYYTVDGGAQQSGTAVAITTEGTHTISYWSVDLAGNAETAHSVTVKLDKTNPTITHTAAPAANGNGWNNADVTVTFACGDALSGVASCTVPVTVTTEGQAQPVTGTATDNAGNTAADTVTVNLDKTAPTITGAPDRAANAAGWYNADVTVSFTCADTLSGVATCTAPATLGEGGSQSASGTVTDKADHTASTTVTGINIDKTAPATTADAPAGWQTADVTVHFAATDALSGVAVTHYSLDGGAAQDGAAATITTDGTHSLQYWSVDVAGNAETAHTVTVKLDKTSPTISHGLNPAPNADGWNKADVTVTFTCADATSGVAGCTAPVTVTAETAGQAVLGAATDTAGNTAADSVTVKLDKTAPTISGAADRAANASGWYNADVTVTFTCADALSGVASCTSPVTLGEGSSQSASGTVVDAAGNSGSATVSGINIDETKPTLSGAVTAPPNANGWYSSDVTIHWTAADTLSGIDTATVPADATVTGEGDNLSKTASVSDKAGNSQTATVSGIKIDRQAPSTTDDAATAWQKANLTVTLTPADTLSGVANTYYTVDGGAQQTGTAVAITTEGTHTISYWSVDLAGNAETAHSVTVKLDKTNPTITHTAAPGANGNGWNNTDVTVHFTCADALAGIASCTADQTLTTEGANQQVTGTAVDAAGNSATSTATVNIDKTAPTITASATTADGQGYTAGAWTNQDVTVTFTCADPGGSGVASCPNAQSFAASGSATGTVTDAAGNSATSVAFTVNIDKTAPTIAASATTADGQPYTAGAWTNQDVTISFTCADLGGSGVASCPAPQTLAASGTPTGTVTDGAGNSATSTAFTVNIDKTAPTVTASATTADGQPYTAGAWTNRDVTVTYTCDDQGGSGVASCPTAQSFTASGSATGTATDVAGNSATSTAFTVNIDKNAPATTDDAPTAWQKADITVTLTPADSHSGVASTYYTLDGGAQQSGTTVSVSTEGTHTISYWSVDAAGNSETAHSVTVQMDKTAPTISGAATTAPNGAGWYNADVTVHFTCSDDRSGVASCPADETLGEGADQHVDGTVTDNAGNTASYTVTGINVDKTPPVLVLHTPPSGAIAGASRPVFTGTAEPNNTVEVYLDDVLAATLTANAGGAWSYQPATGLADGSHTWKATATDIAGNVTTSATRKFTIDTTPPPAPPGPPVVVPPVVVPPHNPGLHGQVLVAAEPGSAEASGSLGDGTRIEATIAGADGKSIPLTVDSNGNYVVNDLAPGEYRVVFQVVAPSGERLAGTIGKVRVSADGTVTIDTGLIDPYGTVTDAVTGRPVPGVKMRLMWADTPLNREAGRTPDTEVKLPAIPGFAPNDNADPQMTNAHGVYAWMVFPKADYYVLGEKDGYQVYDSRKEGRNVAALPGEDSYVQAGVIHVGEAIVKYDLLVQPNTPSVPGGTPHTAFIKGYPDGTFQPEAAVTRAEAATMLARALSGGSSTGTATFKDVPATHWAAQSIAFVQARGLMVGDPDGTFRPDATITRAELAAIVTRIKGVQPVAGATFADVEGHWAAGVVEAARRAGLVTGFPDGGYHPEAPATRAQFTVVLARTLGRGTHAGPATFSDVPETYWAFGFIEEAAVDHIMKSLSDGAETW